MNRSFKHEFEAKLREEVTVSLPENATTGFVWSVSADDGLKIVKTAENLPEPNVIGGGYSLVFNVSADKAGSYTMKTDLTQPWDQHTPPAEIHTFEFNFVD